MKNARAVSPNRDFWQWIAAAMVFLGAQTLCFAEGEPYDAAFQAEYPKSGNTELYNPDLSMPYSEEKGLEAAKTLASDQQAVLDEVFLLAGRLDERKLELLRSLGAKRVEDIRAALSLPEGNQLQKARKNFRLQQLNAGSFSRMDFDTEDGLREIGEKVYELRAVRGEKIEELAISIAGIGKAEPTSIDQIVFSRIVHEKTGIAFLLLDNEISFDSKHLKQYIARVRYESNHGRGRPVVLLSYNHSPVEEGVEAPLQYKFYDRPHGWKERAKLWFDAKYVAPTRGQAIVTAMSVLFQVGTTEGITAVQYALGNIHEWSHTASALSAVYGTVFGLWGSFYYNMTKASDPHNRTSRTVALAKRMMLSSATFAWNLQILNHGLHSVSFYTVGGLSTNLAIASNTLTNNAIKDEHIIFNDIREGMGLSRGTIEVLGTKIKKTQIERQLVYQLSFVLKIGDLVGLSAFGVPVGSALFYSSYVWSQYLVMKYAEAVNYEKKAELVAKWKRLTSLPGRILSFPGRVTSELGYALMIQSPKQLLLNGFYSAVDSAKSACKNVLKAFQKEEYTPTEAPFIPSENGEWLIANRSQP